MANVTVCDQPRRYDRSIGSGYIRIERTSKSILVHLESGLISVCHQKIQRHCPRSPYLEI